MKRNYALALMLLIAGPCLLPGAGRAQSGPAHQPAAAQALTRNPYSHAASAHAMRPTLPDRFTAYASESIGNNQICVAGRTTDVDGINQKPVVYVAEQASKRLLWITSLDVPPEMYQSRATHCTRRGESVYVLLQSDTQSEQSLSQTLLRVVKLGATNGTVQIQQDIDVPTAYSAWVDEGATHFTWHADRLVVEGHDRLDADHEQQGTFTLRLNDDLKP